jgi:type I restriction enzyme S subunit
VTPSWPSVPFEQVVASRGSGTQGLPQKEWLENGAFPVIGQGVSEIEGWTDRHDLLIHPAPAVVLYGGHTRRAKLVQQPFVPGPNVKILKPDSRLDPAFLYYFLVWLPVESKGYADHFPLVRKCTLPLPPLPEQRRIVALLDAAFEGIATAAANAERNLQNARDLFESHLAEVFSRRGEGWVETTLDELAIVDWGNTDLTKAAYVPGGEFLAVSAAGCDGRIGTREHARHTPVLSAIGAQCGRVFLPDEDFTAIKNTMTLTPIAGRSDGSFLFHLLSSTRLPRRGAAQPFLAKADVCSHRVVVPTCVSHQQSVAKRLDAIAAESSRLSGLYEQKQSSLAALKRSLLHQAFNGEL